MSSRRVDLVLALREARRQRGLTQKDVALRSGVGAKTISSFETGDRASSMKISQLEKLLDVYGLTLAEFFAWSPDDEFEISRPLAVESSDSRRGYDMPRRGR